MKTDLESSYVSASDKWKIIKSIPTSRCLILIAQVTYFYFSYSTLFPISNPESVPSATKKTTDSSCLHCSIFLDIIPSDLHSNTNKEQSSHKSPLTVRDTAFFMSTTRQSRDVCPTPMCQLAWDCGDWCEHYLMQCEDCGHVWDGESQCDHMH